MTNKNYATQELSKIYEMEENEEEASFDSMQYKKKQLIRQLTERKLILDKIHVERIREKLGPFNYSAFGSDDKNIERRDAVEFEDGTKYEGQWIIDLEIRHGQGMMIYTDGSVYEGFWQNNKRNGHGR